MFYYSMLSGYKCIWVYLYYIYIGYIEPERLAPRNGSGKKRKEKTDGLLYTSTVLVVRIMSRKSTTYVYMYRTTSSTWLYLFVRGHLIIIMPLVMEVPRHRIWRSRGAS